MGMRPVAALVAGEDHGVERDQGDRKVGRMGRHALVAGAEDGVRAVEPAHRRASGARRAPVAVRGHVAEVQAPRRCIRLPPIDAMLRSCAEALSSNACAMTGYSRRTRGSAARSVIRTSEPTRSARPSRSTLR